MNDFDLLNRLVQLFYAQVSDLGIFSEKRAEELPENYQRLLAHNEHMTVTVEAFHGCSVNVEILATAWMDPFYCRKIVLRRSCDGQVVLFGLVRLDTSVLPTKVRDEIVAGQTPLGRVLIQNDVLRRVELEKLWQVQCGQELASYFGETSNGSPSILYGRTARIHFGTSPALELLEVVS